MSTSVSSITATKTGGCPHGLPAGACPICSGMGGSTKVKTADFSAKPGEMSWNECAAIGAFLKSLKNAKLARNADFQQRLLNIAQFEATLTKSVQQLNQFIQSMSKNALTKPLAFIAQKVLLPILNRIKNLPVNIINTFINIANKLSDISDKLAAVFGEMKLAVNKKISDFSKAIKRKIKSIFEVFSAENDNDENEVMIAFEKHLDKLKNVLEKIADKLKKEIEEEIID